MRSERRWIQTKVGVALGAAGLMVAGGLVAPAGAAEPEPETSADLSIEVTVAPESVQALDEVAVTVTARNAGPDAAVDVLAGISFDYPLELQEMPESCSRSFTNNSVVCELGDVASGSEASAEITLQPYSSGFFTLPAAITSSTPDPTSGDRSTTATLIVTRGPSQAVRYINGIFPMILRRSPDAGALEYWSQRWAEAYRRYPQRLEPIPGGMMASQEYRALRVRDAYQRILGRNADAGSVTYWTGQAARGVSFEKIELLLIGSGEFAAKNAGATTAAVFQAVLGRAPTGAELSQWGSTRPVTVGAALQRSTEGYDVIIKDRFQRTLGEAPSAFARYIWQVRLRNGFTPERLWAQLLVSWEVLQDYPFTEEEYFGEGQPVYDFSGRAGDLDKDLADAG